MAGMREKRERFFRPSVRPELILISLLVLVIISACASREAETVDTDSREVSGPALIMFYTDN